VYTIGINATAIAGQSKLTTNMKKLFAIAVAQAFGMLLNPQQSAALTTTEIVAKTKPAIVWIGTSNDKDFKTGTQGTGFFVDHYTIITNDHVLRGQYNYLFVCTLNGVQYHIDRVCFDDPAADIAVIHTVENSPSFIDLAGIDPAEGNDVVVIGNPRNETGTVTTGIVSAIRTYREFTEMQISAPISHGSSGSPVMNSNGEVIGMAKAVREDGQNLNFAVHLSSLAVAYNHSFEKRVVMKEAAPVTTTTTDSTAPVDDTLQRVAMVASHFLYSIQSAKPAADAGTYLDNKLFEWYGTNNVSKADAIKDLWKHAALYPVQSTVSDWDNASFVKSGNLIVTKVPITWNGTDRQGKVKTVTRFAYVAVNVKTFLIDGVKNDDK
jgi:Trypsin-like peptidase domain